MSAEHAPYESLFGAPTGDNPKRSRGRPKGNTSDKLPTVTKGQIIDILAMANMAVAFSPYGVYQLNRAEIDALADAWYAVIKENPYIAKYLVVGKKLGVWGNLIFIHYQIVAARINLFNAKTVEARTARANGGPERERQNNASGESTILT